MGEVFGKGYYLYLIDGLVFIFCVYYVLFFLMWWLDGVLIGVVVGFCNMLWKYIQDGMGSDVLIYVVVIFDYFLKMFCNEIYLFYKVNCFELFEDL